MLASCKFYIILTTLVFLGLGYIQILDNSEHISSVSSFLRSWAKNVAHQNNTDQIEQITELRRRVNLYHEISKRDFLEKGMLVHRSLSGKAVDECDSLLFSNLNFIALEKLGFQEDAEAAWKSIEQSQKNGQWVRHPNCANHSTSRDMIIGILLALSQKPENHQEHFKQLLQQIDAGGGFFHKGPIYVSYISPNLAEAIRLMARLENWPHHQLPSSIRSGFSTSELQVSTTQAGYRTHLLALLVWLEFELRDKYKDLNLRPRSSSKELAALTGPFTVNDLDSQRLEYLTQSLMSSDPRNLFFKYLRIKAADALTVDARIALIRELNDMRQFPKDRLPRDCDRKADYLWQRDSQTYNRVKAKTCNVIYNGTDFLWMAGLLLEGLSLE